MGGDTVARDLLMLNLKLILMLMPITDMAVALEGTVDMAMVDTASDTQDMVDTVWEVTEAMVDTADTGVPLEDMEESGDRPQTITISSSSISLIDYFFFKIIIFQNIHCQTKYY